MVIIIVLEKVRLYAKIAFHLHDCLLLVLLIKELIERVTSNLNSLFFHIREDFNNVIR